MAYVDVKPPEYMPDPEAEAEYAKTSKMSPAELRQYQQNKHDYNELSQPLGPDAKYVKEPLPQAAPGELDYWQQHGVPDEKMPDTGQQWKFLSKGGSPNVEGAFDSPHAMKDLLGVEWQDMDMIPPHEINSLPDDQRRAFMAAFTHDQHVALKHALQPQNVGRFNSGAPDAKGADAGEIFEGRKIPIKWLIDSLHSEDAAKFTEQHGAYAKLLNSGYIDATKIHDTNVLAVLHHFTKDKWHAFAQEVAAHQAGVSGTGKRFSDTASSAGLEGMGA
jgi:hypothetical protein